MIFWVLLFQIPADHGLEFRVTNLGRYKMVENCFLAELVYCGDLMIPLRRCNQNFYGIIKGFTVDQEIKAEIMPCSGAAEGTKDQQKAICIRYQAFCSVKLHNRCFCAEKCCVLLSIDGGPEGFFRTELDTRKTGLQVVQIAPEHDTPLGTSTLQIICNPKNYEMLCVSWTVKLSPNDNKKASSWLPRVYPGPSGSNDRAKHYLRYTHLERGDESPAKSAANHHPGESSSKMTPEGSEAGLQTQEQPLGHLSHSEESGAADASPVGGTEEGANIGEGAFRMTAGEVMGVGEEARGAASGVDGGEIIQRGEDAIAGQNGKHASLATKGLVVVFCLGVAVGGMFTSVWLDNIYTNALSRSFRGSSQPPVIMSERGINLTSEVSSVAADENHSQQMLQLNNTESVEGDVNLSEEPTEQESVDAEEVELEELGSGADEVGEKQQPLHPHQTRSFRDQVDYWLGWRGPIVPDGGQV
ncbi:hypothetical protein BO86DRAFT_164661 [Aspergillus japonicus CBS 114.51]|uniref:Uncharacterized protein n=1 Tax=Aspergillus japonicus CBS 114.51 TaxID=1448312 RepID=A0A8T8XC90_ASPJA|nr:hypothetical protein BO86DRAFT_164661 [Aspergillus japonicus CBS 114.51]RAH85715.1 hypothetical protein BO86DRAFT_164661 [Aspergillus japonicus CBS 114.51]